jgi:hypothetical protein
MSTGKTDKPQSGIDIGGASRLLDVAVRRARGLGRGGNITRVSYTGSLDLEYGFEGLGVAIDGVRVFAPELFDVDFNIDIVRLLIRVLRRIALYGSRSKTSVRYLADPESLPLELQIVLKKAFEAAVTTVSNVLGKKGAPYMGSLFAVCDPKVEKLEVRVDPINIDISDIEIRDYRDEYYVSYTCKSHVGDLRLMLRIIHNKIGISDMDEHPSLDIGITLDRIKDWGILSRHDRDRRLKIF